MHHQECRKLEFALKRYSQDIDETLMRLLEKLKEALKPVFSIMETEQNRLL
jgi:hypothetical protein